MDDLTNWAGARVCDAFAALGAEPLVNRTCSTADSVFGLGLITCVFVVLMVVGTVVFVRS